MGASRWTLARAVSVLGSAAVLCVAGPAAAAELWLAQPSACAIADELSRRAERALGQPLATAGALVCTIHIVHDHGARAARIEFERPGQPSQLRSFRAPTCARLTDTLALAVALAVVTGPASAPSEASISEAAPHPAAGGRSGVPRLVRRPAGSEAEPESFAGLDPDWRRVAPTATTPVQAGVPWPAAPLDLEGRSTLDGLTRLSVWRWGCP